MNMENPIRKKLVDAAGNEKFFEYRQNARKKYKKRYHGRWLLQESIRKQIHKGRLRKSPCVTCGATVGLELCTFLSTREKPVWYCGRCHRKLHKGMRKVGCRVAPVDVVSG